MIEVEMEVEEDDGIVSWTIGFSAGLLIVIASSDFDDDDDGVAVAVAVVADSQQGNTIFPLIRRVSTGEKGSTGSKKEGNIA